MTKTLDAWRGFVFRQSKIQNQKAAPQTKMGWDCRHRPHARNVRGGGAGAAAGENSPDRNSDRRPPRPSFRPGSKHFANGCASLAMSKEKTLSLSTDMQKGNSNGCLTLQPNWSVSKLTSSSPPARAILAAKKASATIPIVFAAAADPVGDWACLQPGATRREYHRT